MIRMQQGDVGVQTPNDVEKSEHESTDSEAYKFHQSVNKETPLNCIPYDENDTNLFKQKTMQYNTRNTCTDESLFNKEESSLQQDECMIEKSVVS